VCCSDLKRSLKLVLLILFIIGIYTQEATNNATGTAEVQPTQQSQESELNDLAMKDKFERFIRKYKKSYTTSEEKQMRYHIFVHNVELASNLAKEEGQATFGITKFFDLTEREFERMFLTLDPKFEDMMKTETEFEDYSDEAMTAKNITDLSRPHEVIVPNATDADHSPFNHTYDSDEDFESDDPNDDPNYGQFMNLTTSAVEEEQTEAENKKRNLQGSVPYGWDWRRKGAVTYVRNQGTCGACWAFSTVANVEGLIYNKYGVLVALSEQHLLDCNTFNNGCLGGTLPVAFNYVRKSGGINLRSTYPYRGVKMACRANYQSTFGTLKGYVSPGMNENDIKNMLYAYGPLSAGINSRPLYYYVGGVFNPTTYQCSPYGINHGISIVGYGTTASGMDYWIIKNSWGPNWGERGFFRIRRGTGACGINRMVYSGLLQ